MHRNVMLALLSTAAAAVLVITLLPRESDANQSAGQSRVAAVNVVRVINEYDRFKDLRAEIQRLEENLQNEVATRRGNIDAMQQAVNQMAENDPALQKQMEDLLRAQIEFKNWFDMTQAGRVREYAIWIRRIHTEVRDLAERIAERDGFTMVLADDREALQGFDPDQLQQQIASQRTVWVSPQADITQLVIDELNKSYRQQPKQPMLQPTLGN